MTKNAFYASERGHAIAIEVVLLSLNLHQRKSFENYFCPPLGCPSLQCER